MSASHPITTELVHHNEPALCAAKADSCIATKKTRYFDHAETSLAPLIPRYGFGTPGIQPAAWQESSFRPIAVAPPTWDRPYRVATAPGGNRAFALDLLGIHIPEPDVPLTDLALTIECLAIVGWLAVMARAILSPLKLWFLVFYLSIAVAALFGAIVHGFFSRQMGGMHDRLWTGTLVALGANALACWNLSAKLMAVGARTEKIVQGATVAAFLGYCLYVVSAFRKFLVAVIAYLPATLFLLGVVIKLHLKEKSSTTMIAVVALIMTLVAAAVQQLKISIHPVYFNYNALYHVIQGIALLIFARFALWAVTNDKGIEG